MFGLDDVALGICCKRTCCQGCTGAALPRPPPAAAKKKKRFTAKAAGAAEEKKSFTAKVAVGAKERFCCILRLKIHNSL